MKATDLIGSSKVMRELEQERPMTATEVLERQIQHSESCRPDDEFSHLVDEAFAILVSHQATGDYSAECFAQAFGDDMRAKIDNDLLVYGASCQIVREDGSVEHLPLKDFRQELVAVKQEPRSSAEPARKPLRLGGAPFGIAPDKIEAVENQMNKDLLEMYQRMYARCTAHLVEDTASEQIPEHKADAFSRKQWSDFDQWPEYRKQFVRNWFDHTSGCELAASFEPDRKLVADEMLRMLDAPQRSWFTIE